MDQSIPSHLDPPNHLFRIRLACVLLETCGKEILLTNVISSESFLRLFVYSFFRVWM